MIAKILLNISKEANTIFISNLKDVGSKSDQREVENARDILNFNE